MGNLVEENEAGVKGRPGQTEQNISCCRVGSEGVVLIINEIKKQVTMKKSTLTMTIAIL